MKINVLLTLFLSVVTFTTTDRAQSSDEVAIRKTLDAIRPVFDQHDLTAFSGFFKNSSDLYYQIITIDHQQPLTTKHLKRWDRIAPGSAPANT